jgi:hypothetical protein
MQYINYHRKHVRDYYGNLIFAVLVSMYELSDKMMYSLVYLMMVMEGFVYSYSMNPIDSR